MSITVFVHGHICDNWLVNTWLIIAERLVKVVTIMHSALLFISTVINPILLEYLMLVQVTSIKSKLIIFNIELQGSSGKNGTANIFNHRRYR